MKTKFQILIVVLLALALIAGTSINLTRLRVKNISAHPVAMWLDPVEDGKGIYYYFYLEEGTRVNPVEKVYTVIPAMYNFSMQVDGVVVTNPFCLPAADLDKTSAGIQIEIKTSKQTMIFEKCASLQDLPDRYDKNSGIWKSFDNLWRFMYKYVTNY